MTLHELIDTLKDLKNLAETVDTYQYDSIADYQDMAFSASNEIIKTLLELDLDKLENGTLVELPLPLGAECYSIIIDWNSVFVAKRKFELIDFALYWGKITFATKAEAEAELAKIRGQNDNND